MPANVSARTRALRGFAGPLMLAALLAGCAHAPPPPPTAPRPKPGYERRVDELNSVDASRLAGQRIAIDPGHGGLFRGALGQHGLTEAEVNLGVALALDSLLTSRGAIVFLTRSTDRDFLTPADSSLKGDLTERARLAGEFHPDLFLSIHHNADARGAHDVNETQTYYKLGDDGPSLDAASDVHRYLVRNLGIEKHRILPGNYLVLRSCASPALLTESSYITNPDVEAKLQQSDKRRLEAEALYLGLAKYFARRAPEIDTVWAFAPGGGRGDTTLRTPYPVIAARVRGAFDRVRLTLDGDEVEPVVRGDSISWTPDQPLAMGPHEAMLSARLAGEGAARPRTTRFRIAGARELVVAEFPDQTLWTGDQPLGLRMRVLSDAGTPYRDSLRVRVRSVGAIQVSPADTQVVLPHGEGWLYYRARKWAPRRARPHVSDLSLKIEMLTGHGDSVLEDSEPVFARITTWAPAGRRTSSRTGFARAMPGDTVLCNAPGTTGDDPSVTWINADGFIRLYRDSSGDVAIPRLAGYRPWPTEHGAQLAPRDSAEAQSFVPVPAAAPEWPPAFVAICGGALHGHRIVLDPAGGGDETGGEGVSGTRAAALNLQVARALAGYLAAAGAQVKLTREGDLAISDVERVQISEAFHAERYLRIGHAPEPPMLGYYFSSAAGKAWASRTQAAFAALGLPAPRPGEDAQYPLQQTSCPALFASPARVDDPASEERLLAPGVLRAEAYALFVSLAREWATDAAWPVDSLDVRDAAGQPAAGAPVTLGGAFVLQSGTSGRVRFARTEPGPIGVEWSANGSVRRRVLLESDRGAVLSTGATGR